MMELSFGGGGGRGNKDMGGGLVCNIQGLQ